MPAPIPFSGCPLDRAERERRDPAWIQSQLDAEESRFLPIWKLQALVKDESPPVLAWARGIVRDLADPRVGPVLLGLRDGIAHFAVDISGSEDPVAALELEGQAKFDDIRALAMQLSSEEVSMAGYARARVDWHARHGFCAVCGGKTVSEVGGNQRRCQECSAEHFPRTDPVAIAVVTRGDQCLLGRQRGWPPTMYSALAGFVDSAESIEEAVAREIQEESGLRVRNVRYVESQPWPFPGSLMIGCIAEAEEGELDVDTGELEEAGWFDRERIAKALDGAADTNLIVPPPMAIAHHLLRAWVAES